MNTSLIKAEQAFGAKSEKSLIKASQQGDSQAFQQLYEAHIGKVYALCLRLTGDKSLAEDAAQEVFIQLWNKIGNFKGESKFSTWLHSVTANITLSYMRKQRGWWQRMLHINDTDAVNREAPQSTDLSELEGFIQRLPQRARIVFVLHAVEGYRHEQIAAMTNMAVGSSKAQFHRAKQLLKEWMDYE